jgi:TolB protein
LFVDGKAAARELKILDLVNGSERFLTNNDYAEAYPDWSADGKWIAYTIKDSDCNIWIIAPTGGERIQLTDQSTIEIAPHFSPDGKLISFISDRDGYFNVWAIAISGGSPFQITFNKDQGKINLGHCWSADGKYIYYCRTIRGIRNIWKISLQHGRQEQLTFYTSATEHVSRGSRISTDGIELFFATYERTGDIWLMKDQSIH